VVQSELHGGRGAVGTAVPRAGRGDCGDDEGHENGGEEDGDEALHRGLLGRREEHARSLRPRRRRVVRGGDTGSVTAATETRRAGEPAVP